MRTSKITVAGKEYTTCLSTRVLVALEERGGDADKELARIMQGKKLADLFWLLAQMIDAGDRYAELEGLDNPGTLSLDELMDRMGPDDYEAMTGALADTVKAGSTPTVESKPAKGKGKNAEARQAAG